MDGVRFDAVARFLGSVVERRATARALAGGALAGLGLPAGYDVNAKKKKRKKKKCKKPKVKCGKKCCAKGQRCFQGRCIAPCSFTKTATFWTLQGDCTATSRIDFPDGVTLDGDGNTIVGPGPITNFSVGVWYEAGATGEMSGNAISNFFDSDAGDVACGIRVEATAGAVTIGTNTFPDPPGNEQDVCDNRP